MARPKASVSSRIRNVKSSLDSAERSFRDNKEIRGELDLMLAEAELENLRRKKNVPWNWNRQLLAVFFAVLLAAAGACGWYFARGEKGNVADGEASSANARASWEERPKPEDPAAVKAKKGDSLAEKAAEEAERKIELTKSDLRRLVQSARTELNSSQ